MMPGSRIARARLGPSWVFTPTPSGPRIRGAALRYSVTTSNSKSPFAGWLSCASARQWTV